MPNAILTINLSAILANYRLLQARLGQTECGAVVKADAYGLGVQEVAEVLASGGCKKFFVATMEEGIQLRQTLKEQKIYVFHGVMPGEEKDFSQHKLVPVLNSPEQIEAWNRYAGQQETRYPALLQLDTGMLRLGLSRKELAQLAEQPDQYTGITLEYVISHLACADEPSHPKNREQLALFEDMPHFLRDIPRSFSNSSGIFLGSEYHFDLARPGAALYGVNPVPARPNVMQGVITLSSHILQLRNVDFIQAVGYGASYSAAAGTKIAVVPVGYADGYFRSLGNKGCCFIGGKEVPVIGRISMDMIMLDVTAIDQADIYPGAQVEIIGGHSTIDEMAARAGTIGYEVLTNLGKRYKRVYS